MPTDHRGKLATIKRFDQLIAYLRDEMGWPIGRDSFEEVDNLFYEFTADELGIDPTTAAKIQEIKRLRPLSPRQPWGIFFVKFEPKRLPVVALRRILGQVALRKRASANSAERAAWAADDLLFVSNYGDGDERQISFAHFARASDGHDLPTLKVLGWDNRDTALHLDAVTRELSAHLAWPEDDANVDAWRNRWRAAFTLRHREVVSTSKQLSIRLAELARSIRDRINTALAIETDKGPLTQLMKAFRTALVHDLDADGFADMYAQTVAYGLLSARISDPRRKTADDFAAQMRTNPFLRELMETFLKVGGRRGKAGGPGVDFDELGVSEVVELLDAANMEAVVRDFGDRNPQEDPVLHFYELFLKEYDSKKRIQRGVFYTPRAVVAYIVRSVDELLRNRFGLADGLADTATWGEMAQRHKHLRIPDGVSPDQHFVQILDPATGTGTFLVEVIGLIHETLVAKWKVRGHDDTQLDELWNEYVPGKLLTRLYGYELLMAPYAIAHLKIGLKLYETGYRFESDERARVYLTNALERASDTQLTLALMPALAHEVAAVNDIKRNARFTVVVGNPPYSILSGNLAPEHRALVDRYRFVDGERIKERGALQFEKNIQDDYVKFFAFAEDALAPSSAAILAFVTNANYLDASTFRGLRASLIASFPLIEVADLHGDGTGSFLPASQGQDENVFDILQGVAVGIYCRGAVREPEVKRLDIGGSRDSKFRYLLGGPFDVTHASSIVPAPAAYEFSSKVSGGACWDAWPRMNDIFQQYSAGIITARDVTVISDDPKMLAQNVRRMRDSAHTDKEFLEHFSIAEKKGWSVSTARRQLRSVRDVDQEIHAIAYRPFDSRFIFYHQSLVWGRAFPTMRHVLATENLVIAVCKQLHKRTDPWRHVFVCRTLGESSLVSNKSKEVTSFFPMLLADSGGGLLNEDVALNAADLRAYFPVLERSSAADDRSLQGKIAGYIYAILNSQCYRDRFRDELARDFPRVPVSQNNVLFEHLVRLGNELIALHLLESPKLDHLNTEFVGSRVAEVEKVSWVEDTVWLDKAQTAGFKGVCEEVWNFHVGAYRVCEKWLKDRKGRRLSNHDIAHYQQVVVALSESVRLMRDIDEIIERHGGWPAAFQIAQAKARTDRVVPLRPPIVEPTPADRYVTCVPLVPLKAAAGAFSDPQQINDDGFEWVAVDSRHRLRKGMFVAQVVGRSMEPKVPDASYCLFRSPVEGTRQGKTVLVQLRDATDPETGERYTIKRYESEKCASDDSWHHERIVLKPNNSEFRPIEFASQDAGELTVIAELMEVIEPQPHPGST